jgi:hypothetical protein
MIFSVYDDYDDYGYDDYGYDDSKPNSRLRA